MYTMMTPKRAVIMMERPFCVTALKTFCRSLDLVLTSSRWKANLMWPRCGRDIWKM